ncbi:hypothetical protein FRACYDRAFT_250793 [Fragilariopsis cylindrus CCMP1102]|uniref:SET domain-containing protein n=1 Tax=Fragilariopsis cylindrus CCMP1102 TaxID=635003 RepID=A0A1E7EPP5_9STRA|nr:hypothetical protein FRACYDRAFT_250793 [Fragilariopsis cylindrus CCMP1102]|eukprot:OEU07767.1 hypothetical protein FRACYDRAFT_250793 [Fragilariopsis cylindrus CCMP1102]
MTEKNCSFPATRRQQQQRMSSVAITKAEREVAGRRVALPSTSTAAFRFLLLLLGLLSSSVVIAAVPPRAVDAVDSAAQDSESPECGLWLGPSPIKEAEEHGWGHSMFTGKFIKKGQIVLGSGIYDLPSTVDENGNGEEENHDYQETPSKPRATRGHKEKSNENEVDSLLLHQNSNSLLFQQLWNGDYYNEQVLESYDSMRIFIPGLANIAPCTSDNFNLEQMSSVQNINYRDWRSTGTSSSSSDVNKDDHQESQNKKHKNHQHDKDGQEQTTSHQSGSFSYWSNRMFVASRDIQVGEELVVECSDNSDEFDPKDYPPVRFQPKEIGGYSICLDDKIEERIADHTTNVCSNSILNEKYNEVGGRPKKDKTATTETNGNGGQRGLFAKRTLYKDEILTSSPTIPIHKNEMNMFHTKHGGSKKNHTTTTTITGAGTDNLGDDSNITKREQLLLNYCYGHKDSSLLWLPTAPLLHSANHASSNDPTSKLQPNARIQWHHDIYDLSKDAQKITRRQRFHHLELLQMNSHTVLKQNGMGLMMDLIALRTIYEDEEILIDYGTQWNDKWIKHEKEWQIALDDIKDDHKLNKNKRKAERVHEHDHRHKQKEVHNSMTSPKSYITANEYNKQHSTEVIRTISEQHHKSYPTNIETACYFETDWLDDKINEDAASETVTYESWYKQDDHFDVTKGGGCLLPCIIMERHDTATHNFGGSSYKERYTAKLIDTHIDNTSIDYECHIYNRFEYIYEDMPREGLIFVNKPHSTDVWLPKAFREPIGLPDDMVPNIWKDLLSKSQQKQAASTGGGAGASSSTGGGGGGTRMRGGGGRKKRDETAGGVASMAAGAAKDGMAVPLKKMNDYVHKDLLTKPIHPAEEYNYQLTLNRWTEVETRRERLSEMEEKKSGLHPDPSELLGLQEL